GGDSLDRNGIRRWTIERCCGDSLSRQLASDDRCPLPRWAVPLRISDLEDRHHGDTKRVRDVHRTAVVADENVAACNFGHHLTQRGPADYGAEWQPLRLLVVGAEKDHVSAGNPAIKVVDELLKAAQGPALGGVRSPRMISDYRRRQT